MKDKEITDLAQKLEKLRAKLGKSPMDSKNLLINAGIITNQGKLKANYKHLCIPQAQV